MSRIVFYNAGPPSETRPRDASRDVGGLLREYRPRVLVACEVIGDVIAPHPGYGMARDTSRAGRANLVAFVRDDCQWRHTWWADHRTRWTRPKHPELGPHPARSTIVLGIGEAQLLGAHNVPMGTDATHVGQLELVDAATLIMSPWRRPRVREDATGAQLDAMRARPRIMLWDDNAPEGTDGIGADYLAHRINGKRTGQRIDNAVTRMVPVSGKDYVTQAGGRQLATDHPWGALVVHLERGAIKWTLS